MKINRFFALAAIALLVVGAMGVISAKALARTNSAPAAQTQNCDQQDDEAVEEQDAPDTDNIEEQCGDQNGPDEPEAGAAEAGEAEDAETAPAGTPAITPEHAQAIAMAAHPGTVIQTELDDENGQLVYSVEFEGGVDVKVDAITGQVLGVETDQD